MKNSRFVVVLAFIVLAAVQAAPATAEGCRILISAQGRYWGSVTNHGYTPFTRFAVTVEHDIQDVRWNIPGRGPYLRKCPAIARRAHAVEIAPAHENVDPLMYLFLFMARRSAESARFSGAAPEIDATIEELADATQELQKGIIGNASQEVAFNIVGDLASLSGLGWGEKQIVGYLTDVANESIRGGDGSSIRSRLQSLVLGRLNAGLSDADTQRIMSEMVNLGLRFNKTLKEKALRSISMTATGTAGECDLYYNINLDPNRREYHANFMRTCGTPDNTPDLRGRISTNRLNLDPGAAAAFTANVIEITPTGKILTHKVTNARTGGLAAVTDGGEATAAGLGTPAVTLSFQVADIKEDKEYPFDVFLTTAGGSAAPIAAKVVVQNVAPTIDPPTLSVSAEPNELMTLRGNVRILDRNADVHNPNEVVLTPKPNADRHPDGLDTDHERAELDTFDCGTDRPVNGVYTCSVVWMKGRVARTHAHDEFSSTVQIKDDLGLSTSAELKLEVKDVLPRVLSITPHKRDFMEGDKQTVSLSAELLDYNGRDDIIDVRVDATEAGGGVYHLAHFDQDASAGPKDANVTITLKDTNRFPHKDVEGRYPIKIVAIDGPPAPSDSTEEDTLIKVGNFPPRLCASGIIWGSDRGKARPLCPGEPFTVGVCVEDEEGDELEVIATLAGQTVPLNHIAGANNWTANMFAPREPGRYTVTVTMREKKRAKPRNVVESITIDVIECDEPTDAAWDSKIIPTELCPNDPFTVEPVATLFVESGNRVIHPDSKVLFEGNQALTDEMRPITGFTAPDRPGTYPIHVRSNVLGSDVDYDKAITVGGCEPEKKKKKVDLILHSEQCNLMDQDDARDPLVQLMMFESSPLLTLEYQTAPQPTPPLERVRGASLAPVTPPSPAGSVSELFERLLAPLSPTVHAASLQPSEGLVPEPPVILLESLGNSSGEAFTVHVLNRDVRVPLPEFVGDGIVIEPLKKKAQERLQKEIEKLEAKVAFEGKINAYCLEFLRKPPKPGQMFRLAPGNLQQQFAPARRILEAAGDLQQAGLLNPDSDPLQYLHSIRQWAVWSEERGFDMNGFGDAFVERTKENVEGAGRRWTKEIDQAVRGLVPNRWNDIQRVVEKAKTPNVLP